MQNYIVYALSHDNYLLDFWRNIENDHWKVIVLSKPSELLALTPEQLVLVDADLLTDNALVDWQVIFTRHKLCVASLRPTDTQGKMVLLQGAQAYVQAYSPASVWRQILMHVKNGRVWIGQNLLNRLLSQVTKQLPEPGRWQEGLTEREIEVAQRAALGHSNQLIADDLSITERTVRAHLKAAFTKLGVSDRFFLALKVHGLA